MICTRCFISTPYLPGTVTGSAATGAFTSDFDTIDRFDISFLYREIPDEAIWFKFCYYKCNVGISHDLNQIASSGISR